MKYFFLLLLFAIARPSSAQELLGFVSGWKMDSDCQLIDIATSSPVNGALIDVSLTDNRDNKPQTALSFGQSTSYATLGVVNKLKLGGDKSISFWIKPVPTGSNHIGSIFNYGPGFNIRYQETGANVRLVLIFGNTTYQQANLVANQWQFVTITFQKDFNGTRSKAFYYVDGALVSELDQNKSTATFNNVIALIGPQDQNTLTNGFRGSLDHLRIYDRTLTSAEVQNLGLPVTLEYFRGKMSGETVELSWKTQLEENVSHFELERSNDGVVFGKIGRIEAGKYQYLALDNPVIGMQWYRLKIVDMDGKISYSNIIRISSEDDQQGNFRLYPNPGVDKIQIMGSSAYGKITILNNAGNVVKQKQLSANNTISISDLPAGLYYLIFFDGSKRMSSKFTKL
ncbi:MAG: T9SS type A sorting domain-containing protein [Chitinophagaceae bacterium]|nr:MAG: T9SS type A sorting domain-containing protein [Chitinophagaceae bacterium]